MSWKFPIPNRWWAILTLVCLTVQNLRATRSNRSSVRASVRELIAGGEVEFVLQNRQPLAMFSGRSVLNSDEFQRGRDLKFQLTIQEEENHETHS
jgi:hypothetical protein